MTEYAPVYEHLVGNLLAMARAYGKSRGIKLASVSRLAHGDPPTLENLSRGKGSITLRKYDTSMGWLYSNWPEGEPLPVLPFNIQLSPQADAR